MHFTRRAILATGIGAGIASVSSNPTLAQRTNTGTTPRRRSVGELDLDDPILVSLRAGVAALKARPASAAVSWSTIAAIHGNTDGFNRCPHTNWYFLPWHRAYLVMLERIIRSVTNDPNFAMPYWDWTADRQLPRAFSDATFNGRPNPLFAQRSMRPNASLPDDMVGPVVIDSILAEPNFEIFGTSRPEGQNSLSEEWVTGGGGESGPLEANPHNRIHGRVGGDMGGSNSAIDPIFWMHHCNIDRIWAVWNQQGNQNTTDALWLDMTFVNNFLTPTGGTYSARVRELLNILPLGYRYGLEQPGTAVVASRSAVATSSQNRRVTDIFRPGSTVGATATERASAPAARSTGARTDTAPATRAVVANTQAGAPGKPVEVAVRLDEKTLGPSLSRRAPAPAAERAPSARSAAPPPVPDRSALPATADGRRVLALVSDIKPPSNSVTEIRIFLNCDYLTEDTPVTDPHYVQTISFFGTSTHAAHSGHGGRSRRAPALTVDLTATLQRIGRAGDQVGNQIRVQFLPVIPGQSGGDGGSSIIPGKVEIVVV
jgi:tyrosinase